MPKASVASLVSLLGRRACSGVFFSRSTCPLGAVWSVCFVQRMVQPGGFWPYLISSFLMDNFSTSRKAVLGLLPGTEHQESVFAGFLRYCLAGVLPAKNKKARNIRLVSRLSFLSSPWRAVHITAMTRRAFSSPPTKGWKQCSGVCGCAGANSSWLPTGTCWSK